MITMPLLLVAVGVLAGALLVLVLTRKGGLPTPPKRSDVSVIAERVAAVGKLVALEVNAKEIATATQGWSWLPPVVLSQARLAMVFQFEQQFALDLGAVQISDIAPAGADAHGRRKYRLNLPEIDSSLRLTDVLPYDIQHGRVLGLVEVIPMNATRQTELMRSAQDEAERLFGSTEKYQSAARASAERQLRALLALVDAEVEFVWPEPEVGETPRDMSPEAPLAVETSSEPRRRVPSVVRAPGARLRRRHTPA